MIHQITYKQQLDSFNTLTFINTWSWSRSLWDMFISVRQCWIDLVFMYFHGDLFVHTVCVCSILYIHVFIHTVRECEGFQSLKIFFLFILALSPMPALTEPYFSMWTLHIWNVWQPPTVCMKCVTCVVLCASIFTCRLISYNSHLKKSENHVHLC